MFQGTPDGGAAAFMEATLNRREHVFLQEPDQSYQLHMQDLRYCICNW